MILDNQDVDTSMAFPQCVTACVFSDFLVLKMLYYILETTRQRRSSQGHLIYFLYKLSLS